LIFIEILTIGIKNKNIRLVNKIINGDKKLIKLVNSEVKLDFLNNLIKSK